MSSVINFTTSADQVITRIMSTFLDVKNRPVQGPLTVEELLLVIVRQTEMCKILASFGVQARDMEDDVLISLLDRPADMVESDELTEEGGFPARSHDFELVISRAILNVQSEGDTREVTLLDLLVAVASLPQSESPASRVLHDHGLSQKRLSASVRQWRAQDMLSHVSLTASARTTVLPVTRHAPLKLPLAQVPDDPMFYDVKGLVGPWVSRQDLVDHALTVLAGERGDGLLLVGPQGVGKTALVSEIARQLDTPQHTGRNLPVLGLDISALLAGSQLRGDLERHLLAKIQWLKKLAPHGAVLWIHNVGDLLTSRRQGQDIIAPLRSVLRASRIRLIASATPEQAKQLMEIDATFTQHFVSIRMQMPSASESALVAAHALPRFENHHAVTYDKDLIDEAVCLVMRHRPHLSPLSPVMRALDAAGSAAARAGQKNVNTTHLHDVLSRQFGLPSEHINQTWGEQLGQVESHLKTTIADQNQAIEAIMDVLRLAHAGLGEGGKTRPIGSFFFAGPTGVGKTELSNQLAQSMGVPLLRLDMSEYAERHSASRLIGSPPGYVGYQEGGQLAGPLTQNPRTVVLLDEFEKAAPQVHALFLQVLDRGHITDGQGHHIDCRQALFIFTSNVGAQEASRSSIGFVTNADDGASRRDGALKEAFPPEFRNRFDHIIQFNALSQDCMAQVVDKMLTKLRHDAGERGHQVRFTQALRRWLAKEGYDPLMGARPLQRLINQRVAKELAKTLLSHPKAVTYTVGYLRDQIKVTAHPRS